MWVFILLVVACGVYWYLKINNKSHALKGQIGSLNHQGNHNSQWQLNSDQAALGKIFREHLDLLKCLVYVGRADGRISEKEKEIIINALLKAGNYEKKHNVQIAVDLKSVSTLSNSDFEIMIRKVKEKGPREIRIFSEAVKKIIESGKKLSPGEAYCIDVINKTISGE